MEAKKMVFQANESGSHVPGWRWGTQRQEVQLGSWCSLPRKREEDDGPVTTLGHSRHKALDYKFFKDLKKCVRPGVNLLTQKLLKVAKLKLIHV